MSRILLVDDDLAVLDAKRALLESRSHQVSAAQSVREAISQIEAALGNSRGFDVIICDREMGGDRNAWRRVTDRALDLDPLVQIVLLTGYGGPEVSGEAILAGALSYLEKTVDPVEEDRFLLEVIDAGTMRRRALSSVPNSRQVLADLLLRLRSHSPGGGHDDS